jgi:hypothetical protein
MGGDFNALHKMPKMWKTNPLGKRWMVQREETKTVRNLLVQRKNVKGINMDNEQFVRNLVHAHIHGWKVAFDLGEQCGYCETETKTIHFNRGYVAVLPKTELGWLVKHEIAHAQTPHPPFTSAHGDSFFNFIAKKSIS